MRANCSLLYARAVLCAVVGASVCAGTVAARAAAESADAHIVRVVSIAEVFADGWKLSGVAIEYDKKISEASLSLSDYAVKTEVAGQKILKVYTNTSDEKTAKRGLNGQYVILELSTDFVLPVPKGVAATAAAPAQRPVGPQGARATPVKQDLGPNSEIVLQVGPISWEPALHPSTLKASSHGGGGKSVSVEQVGEIVTADGVTLTATTAAKDNLYCRNLIVDGFLKPDFTGGASGNIKYNIHFPRDYDPAKKYPVVLFLANSEALARYTHAETLIQGQGGVVWASQEDEARHAAIVVAPAFRTALVDESYELAAEKMGRDGRSSTPYQAVLGLMDDLVEKFPSIDRSRIYLTGQGDGARAAIRMMGDRPDLFAAALLFAPDYDPAKIAKVAQAKLWIVAAEDDASSYPSMEKCVASLKVAGAHVGQATWNGQASAAQFAAQVRSLATDGKNIHYAVLKKGTGLPAGVADEAANHHAYTWRTGYSIAALRDWLLTQKK